MKNDKQQSGQQTEEQQAVHSNRNLDDLFKEDAGKENNLTAEEEAEAEQQRKEALTERD